ncbi:hypothetical protein SHLI107390_02665 [Shewanella livingstonensis]
MLVLKFLSLENQQDSRRNVEYWRTSIGHFCIQDKDVEALAEKIVVAGGKSVLRLHVTLTQVKNLIVICLRSLRGAYIAVMKMEWYSDNQSD